MDKKTSELLEMGFSRQEISMAIDKIGEHAAYAIRSSIQCIEYCNILCLQVKKLRSLTSLN